MIEAYPNVKKGAVAGKAGVLFRFVNNIQPNDIVVYPSKADRMVNIGRVSGDYHYVEQDPHEYPNQRSIEWLGSFPRSDFSQSALNEIGAFITLFSVKRHATEFLNIVNLSASLEPSCSHHLNNADDDDADDTDTPDDDTATENIAQQAVQNHGRFYY